MFFSYDRPGILDVHDMEMPIQDLGLPRLVLELSKEKPLERLMKHLSIYVIHRLNLRTAYFPMTEEFVRQLSVLAECIRKLYM